MNPEEYEWTPRGIYDFVCRMSDKLGISIEETLTRIHRIYDYLFDPSCPRLQMAWDTYPHKEGELPDVEDFINYLVTHTPQPERPPEEFGQRAERAGQAPPLPEDRAQPPPRTSDGAGGKTALRRREIEAFLSDHDLIMNADVRELLGVSAATAKRILTRLTTAGILVRFRKGGHWAYRRA